MIEGLQQWYHELVSDHKLLAAVIAAAVSLAAALVSAMSAVFSEAKRAKTERQLATLNATLEEQANTRNARQTYEYDARRRLYADAEPLLFQLYENAAYTTNRIRNLARASREGVIGAWLTEDAEYLASTLHSFLLTLASVEILRQKLTLLDLTLDARIEMQYQLGKAITRSFNRDSFFAAAAPAIPYSLREQTTAATKQGVFGSQVQRAVDALIVADGGPLTIKSTHVFVDEFKQPGSATASSVAEFTRIWRGFTPVGKQIFWRIVIAQLFLLRAIRLTRSPKVDPSALMQACLLQPDELKEFAFSLAPEHQAEVTSGYEIGLRYLAASLDYSDPLR
jgi:hypothetical protein